jgi:hypothetical protein
MRLIIGHIASLLLCCLFAGCAANRVTLGYTYGRWLPVLDGSINGISGHFVIDTGSSAPMLTQTAIERCSIALTTNHGSGYGVGGKIEPMLATNVTISLTQGVTFHLRSVAVFPKLGDKSANTNSDFFGIIDYRTLAARGAVMDMTRKTITLTK